MIFSVVFLQHITYIYCYILSYFLVCKCYECLRVSILEKKACCNSKRVKLSKTSLRKVDPEAHQSTEPVGGGLSLVALGTVE